MKDLPLISVIVPVYGVEKYLDQCIRSIVDQTYSNLEILLVDDGSPDSSGAICDAWAGRDSRIRVIHQKNAGAGAARNAALDIARGELVGMVDSDDYICPHMYEKLYSLLGESGDIAECRIGVTQSDDFSFEHLQNGQVKRCTAEEAMRLHIQDTMFCQTPPNKLYRRSVIRDIRFPVGNLIDDEFFTYRVIGNCRQLVSTGDCMYAYRQQENSAMHRRFSLRRLQGLDAKMQRLEYLRERMPRLEYEAKFDLLFCCIYMMQQSLRFLAGEELAVARKQIREVLADILPIAGNPEASAKNNLLVKAAQLNFEGTCRLLNLLIDLHILS